jgi:hypothetical protein
MLSVVGAIELLILAVQKRVETRIRDEVHIPALASISSIWPSLRHIRFTPEAEATPASLP